MTEEKELKDQRIPIMMTASELAAIDNWSFSNRIRSRGEAIRRLVQIGLMFDEHRKQFLDEYRDIYNAASDVLPLAQEIVIEQEVGERERKLAQVGIETFVKTMNMLMLIRTTTGIANNFKDERGIEEIMKEAKEILASGGLQDLQATIEALPNVAPGSLPKSGKEPAKS